MTNFSKLLFFIFLVSVFCTLMTPVQAAEKPTRAPLIEIITGDLPEGRGFIPSRLDMSHINSKKIRDPYALVDVDTIASFDWRMTGKVSPIKNQSSCGACYSFASLACFESKILVDSNVLFDFSENNAKECNYYSTSCDGGNFDNMANLYNQKGTVLESCDPYQTSDVACNSTCDYQKTLLDWHIISGSSIPSASTLKQYIYDNGPVYTTFYAGDGNDVAWQNEINTYDGSYTMYYNILAYAPNHAVLIVGWDDNASHAGGTGAWIVKNSWGTSWGGTCGYGGESGYFKLAYGSANMGFYSSYIDDWQTYDDAEELLYYDEGGSSESWGFSDIIGYGLAGYTPSMDGFLTRVEFWTNDATSDVDIYIYDDFNGLSTANVLGSQLNNSFAEAGYHSVKLDTPPSVINGDAIYIVVKFTNATYGFPIVADNNGPAEASKTYISSTGTSGSWFELGTNRGSDVAIRARISPSIASGIDDNIPLIPSRYSLSQNYPNPFNPTTMIKYTLMARTDVNISIYNILGQHIKTIVDETKGAGEYSALWNGDNANSKPMGTGIYFYRIETGDFTETRKMVLLK